MEKIKFEKNSVIFFKKIMGGVKNSLNPLDKKSLQEVKIYRKSPILALLFINPAEVNSLFHYLRGGVQQLHFPEIIIYKIKILI